MAVAPLMMAACGQDNEVATSGEGRDYREPAEAARRTVETWLELLRSEEYVKAWDASAGSFRDRIASDELAVMAAGCDGLSTRRLLAPIIAISGLGTFGEASEFEFEYLSAEGGEPRPVFRVSASRTGARVHGDSKPQRDEGWAVGDFVCVG